MASATDPKPDESARVPPPRRGLTAGGMRNVGLGRGLVGAGVALLGCAAVATLLWSWHRSRDGLPLAVVGGTAGVLAAAAVFHALTAARPPPAAPGGSALLAAGLVVLLLLIPHNLNGDDLVRFQDIEALLREGKVTNDPYSLVMP